MFRILIVENDNATAALIQTVLRCGGYDALQAQTAQRAFELLDQEHIDLILLDIKMQNTNGCAFSERLRSCRNGIPLLTITAKILPAKRGEGFILGTDKHTIQPISEDKLLLRIKALLSRTEIDSRDTLYIGKITLDRASCCVSRNGRSQILPRNEFQLLYKLLSHPNKAFTSSQLIEDIGRIESDAREAMFNACVAKLCKRFEDWSEFQIICLQGVSFKAVIR